MTNLLRCLTCNKTITAEEGEKHHCKPIITKHRVISAPSFFTVVDDNGITNIVINGFDHVGYVFEIKEPNLIPIILPCDSHQPKVNTNNNSREDNST